MSAFGTCRDCGDHRALENGRCAECRIHATYLDLLDKHDRLKVLNAKMLYALERVLGEIVEKFNDETASGVTAKTALYIRDVIAKTKKEKGRDNEIQD